MSASVPVETTHTSSQPEHVTLGSIDIFGYNLPVLPSFVGLIVEFVIVVGLILLLRKFRWSKISLLFDTIFEQMYDFFEDILGKDEEFWIKQFVVGMFFIILFSNLLGILLEIIIPIFGKDAAGEFILHHYVQIPSSDINFNVAMAVVSIIIMLFVQWSHGTKLELADESAEQMKYGIAAGVYVGLLNMLVGHQVGYLSRPTALLGFVVGIAVFAGAAKFDKLGDNFLGTIHFLHDYLSVTGRDILTIDRSAIKNPFLYGITWVVIKLVDVLISVFIGALEIVGLVAKVISLAYRLFGNMIAGGILLGILFAALGGATANRLSGWEMPVIAPILVYAQELLIALIQALVFPLLVAIFIRVAQATE